MAITQDGTQRFGIPDSPLNINAVTYIGESLSWGQRSAIVDIEDDEGIPTGQVIIEKKKELSGTLQLATNSTAIPTIGLEFTVNTGGNTNYYITDVNRDDNQGQYSKVTFSAVEAIN